MFLFSVFIWIVITETCHSHRHATIRQNTCLLSTGSDLLSCKTKIQMGCPVRYMGSGCSSSTGHAHFHDGGCQPIATCSFCCQTRCMESQVQNPRCVWSSSRARCMTCYTDNTLATNGRPMTVGYAAFAPSQWSTQALGDSFFYPPECEGGYITQYASGTQFWMITSTYGGYGQPSLPSSLFTRIVLIHRISGFVIADWQGSCHPMYESTTGFYKFSCDFLTDGVFVTPTCGLPQIQPGAVYDYMLQVLDGSGYDLKWLSAMPNPTCAAFNGLCGFQQLMAAAKLPRTDLCTTARPSRTSNLYQNFAFVLERSLSGNSAPCAG